MEDHYDPEHFSGPHWIWGFRHWVYTVTFTTLTLIQVVKIIKWVDVRSKCKNSFPVGGKCEKEN